MQTPFATIFIVLPDLSPRYNFLYIVKEEIAAVKVGPDRGGITQPRPFEYECL